MIYLDNAATTRTYAEANKILYEAGDENYYNASALYGPAAEADRKLKSARAVIAKALKAGEGELYFTSGGTESDNTALFCTKKARGSRIIVSAGEHDAVINPAAVLKEQGYDVVYAPIRSDGSVDKEEFAKLLTPDVSLVSIMHVSNETGAVNDIGALVKLTRKYSPKALFHSDGVQAFCKIPVNLRALDADLYTVSGHKIHAPKGIGGLFVKKGVSVKPFVYGGGQEKGFRSGTENTPAVWAFESAVARNMAGFEKNYSKKLNYIELLRDRLLTLLPDTVVLTDLSNSAPHILAVAFRGIRGEVLLHTLEKSGILVGIGSACSSHRESKFKYLLGLDEEHRDGIVRFSVSEFNDAAEVGFVAEKTAEAVNMLKDYARR